MIAATAPAASPDATPGRSCAASEFRGSGRTGHSGLNLSSQIDMHGGTSQRGVCRPVSC
jgi:hypothetical protein